MPADIQTQPHRHNHNHEKRSFGNKIYRAVPNYYRHAPLPMIQWHGTPLESATRWGFPFGQYIWISRSLMLYLAKRRTFQNKKRRRNMATVSCYRKCNYCFSERSHRGLLSTEHSADNVSHLKRSSHNEGFCSVSSKGKKWLCRYLNHWALLFLGKKRKGRYMKLQIHGTSLRWLAVPHQNYHGKNVSSLR